MNCGPGDDVAQFDVYLNPSPRSREEIPFVVDIQSDLLADLNARLAIDARLLRRPVASLAGHDGEVRDALDAVLSGI